MSSTTTPAEATRRAGVLWLASEGAVPQLVWHLWHDGAAYVVGGGDEQALPPLGGRASVTVRSPEGVVSWDATVETVPPDSAMWDVVTPLLAAERLNAVSAEGLPQRWAQTSTVLRLVPVPPDA